MTGIGGAGSIEELAAACCARSGLRGLVGLLLNDGAVDVAAVVLFVVGGGGCVPRLRGRLVTTTGGKLGVNCRAALLNKVPFRHITP